MITKKQFCLLLFSITVPSKLLILPTVSAFYARQDAWLCALLCFLLDGLMLGTILLVMHKFEGLTFFEILSSNIGIAGAKAVYFCYAIYFLLKAVVPIFEQKMFIEITLYETAPSVLTFLPFFLVSFYLSYKGIRTMARTGEVVFYLCVAGLALMLFLSLGVCNAYYLRPMLKNPVFRMLKGCYSGILWYGQPLILLFFAGRIKKERRFNLSVTLSFCVCAMLGTLLFAVFTGIYGDIAVRQIYSLTKMTKYAIALSNVGRFDYVATLLLVAASVLSLSVPFVMAVDCLGFVFDKKYVWLTSLICSTAMLVVVAIFHMRFQTVLDLFGAYFSPAMIFLSYAVPIITLLLRRTSREKVFEK